MDNAALLAGAPVAYPVDIGEVTDIPPGPLPQTIGEEGGIGIQPMHLNGPGFSVADALGLFNIFVGIMLVMAIIFFVGGLITWAVRLGTLGRHEGIRLMEWGVAILFVLLILLAIVKYLVIHPSALAIVVSIVVGLFICWIIFEVVRAGGAKKKEERPPRP
jgi:small-conductance mechanosensitive channel